MKRWLANLFRQAVANGNPLFSGGLVAMVVISVRRDPIVVIPIAVEDDRAPLGNLAEAGEVEIVASQKIRGPLEDVDQRIGPLDIHSIDEHDPHPSRLQGRHELLYPGPVGMMGSQVLAGSLHRSPKVLWGFERGEKTLLDLAIQREVAPGRAVNRLRQLRTNQDQRNGVCAQYLEILGGNDAQPLKQRTLRHDVYFAAAHR